MVAIQVPVFIYELDVTVPNVHEWDIDEDSLPDGMTVDEALADPVEFSFCQCAQNAQPVPDPRVMFAAYGPHEDGNSPQAIASWLRDKMRENGRWENECVLHFMYRGHIVQGHHDIRQYLHDIDAQFWD